MWSMRLRAALSLARTAEWAATRALPATATATATASPGLSLGRLSTSSSASSSSSPRHPGLRLRGTSWPARLYDRVFGQSQGVPKSRLKVSGLYLMNACAQHNDLAGFLKHLDLPDTYQTWFSVTELHVIMVCARLNAHGLDNPQCQVVRDGLIEAWWVDCDDRAKLLAHLGARERNNYVIQLSQQFQVSLLAYDDGLLGNDRDLANALWRVLFKLKQPPNPAHLELVVSYVRRTQAMLDRIDLDKLIMESQFTWPPLVEKEGTANAR